MYLLISSIFLVVGWINVGPMIDSFDVSYRKKMKNTSS